MGTAVALTSPKRSRSRLWEMRRSISRLTAEGTFRTDLRRFWGLHPSHELTGSYSGQKSASWK
jgi:hypothetical protein